MFANLFSSKRTAIRLIITGLVVIAAGIVILSIPHGEMIKIEATVENVEKGYDTATETIEYTAYLKYEVDGKTYDAEVPAEKSTKKGDKITIEYDSEKPENYQTEGGDIIPFVFLGVGVVLLIAGVFVFLRA